MSCCFGFLSALFYLAHKLVDRYPSKPIAWFAVGCYYLLIGKNDPARRYLRLVILQGILLWNHDIVFFSTTEKFILSALLRKSCLLFCSARPLPWTESMGQHGWHLVTVLLLKKSTIRQWQHTLQLRISWEGKAVLLGDYNGRTELWSDAARHPILSIDGHSWSSGHVP